MQKAERLLDLAALLLRAAEPVAWREIQEQFPDDYGGSEEAAIRKFERDKAELLELGIPVRWAAQDEDLPAGYAIDRDEFYLPNLELAPEDLALLYMAGSAALAQGAFPYANGPRARAQQALLRRPRAGRVGDGCAGRAAALERRRGAGAPRRRRPAGEEARGALGRGDGEEARPPRLPGGRARRRHRARCRSVRALPVRRVLVRGGPLPPTEGRPHLPPRAHRRAEGEPGLSAQPRLHGAGGLRAGRARHARDAGSTPSTLRSAARYAWRRRSRSRRVPRSARARRSATRTAGPWSS